MNQAAFYLHIPEDEIPYSTIARYALLGGFRAPQIMKKIYGNSKKRLHPYLPGLIDQFSVFFELSSENVIEHKTIFPLLKFSQPADEIMIKQIMRDCTDDKVILATAIGHSRFRTFYGLCYCPVCVQQDINNLGFAYWHIKHQIPGVQACFEHNCLLKGIPMGDGNKDRSLILPPFNKEPPQLASTSQKSLALFSSQLFNLSQNHKVNYQEAYRNLLNEKGLVSCNNGFVFISKIVDLLSEYWQELNYTTHLVPGVSKKLASFDFLGRILRPKTHFHAHPLKHILLGCWLTNVDAKKLLITDTKVITSEPMVRTTDEDLKDKIISMLQRGISINMIASQTGKSRCFIHRVADLNRIPHLSNSQAFPESIKRAVLIKALYGVHRQEIADKLKVGLGYVEQVICNAPGMSEWRKHLRIQKNILKASKTLTNIRKLHPEWSRTKIRNSAEAEYFILYNHDKSLIEQLLPPAQKATQFKKDWEKEDQRLLSALETINHLDELSLSAIGRLINDHQYLHRQLNKLPKTKAFLSKAGKLK